MPARLRLLLGFCLVGGASVMAADPAPRAGVIYLEQGWTADDRNWFYNTTQGSRLVPLKWLLEVEQADSEQPLASAVLSDALLYVKPESIAENPHGLPLGFVADSAPFPLLAEQKAQLVRRGLTPVEYESAIEFVRSIPDDFASKSGETPSFWNRTIENGVDAARSVRPVAKRVGAEAIPSVETWIGMTCAACHTTELHYKGQRLRIDGGPAMADFSGFLQSLVASLQATVAEPEKFARFADNVLGSGHDETAAQQLKDELEAYTNGLAGLEARSRPLHPYGFSRLDAFGILTNEIVGTALGQTANYRTPDAPVSYPQLWDTPELDWVQWNGSMHNPLARNVGEVLGVFADLKLPGAVAQPVSTSANLKNLHLLEKRLKTLKSPRWPSEVFGSLDPDKVERGAELFVEQRCNNCHARILAEPNEHGRRLLRTTQVPLTKLGTDSSMAMAFLARTGEPGIFRPLFPGAGPVPIPQLLPAAVGKVMRDEFGRLGLSQPEILAYVDRREGLSPTVEHLKGYKARDLAGIWATAPFLHNGSVPNLDELLQPKGERSPTFQVGSREFNVEKVGFDESQEGFLFDTSLPGNSNAGHEYGTSLEKDDRLDLIEYLKSL